MVHDGSGTDEVKAARTIRRPQAILGSIGFVTVVLGLALRSQSPPDVLPADGPSFAFSAARAMKHVEAIAREPHPIGSAAEEPVRAYIMEELRKLGLEPELQGPSATASGAPASSRGVQNIVARWRGTGPAGKKAVLLSAHYDSVPSGPGAGDDAASVAAILESLRAFKNLPVPERDIIVLFNDGEEAGLRGARLFAEEHPWAKDVAVVLNFEGRGNSGPSFMFETSDQNGWLIEQMARALVNPMASSLTYEVYRLMPNDTDLTVYKDHGMAGWNFAFVGGLYFYHSPEDTPANLDRRTLQHQGDNLQELLQQLVGVDLENVGQSNVVYFSILQRFVVIYPMHWVLPLVGICGLAYVAIVALGWARQRVRIAEIAVGFVMVPIATLVAVLGVGGIGRAVRRRLLERGLIVNREDLGGMPVSRHDIALLVGCAVLAIVITVLCFALASRRWSPEGLGLGAMAWWLAAAAGTSVYMPGASYAFVWPLLGILAGQTVAFASGRGRPIALIAAWLGSIPLLLIHPMIIDGIFNGLNLGLAPLLMIPVVLAASALVPMAGQISGLPRKQSEGI
jgi:Peptidase family M28